MTEFDLGSVNPTVSLSVGGTGGGTGGEESGGQSGGGSSGQSGGGLVNGMMLASEDSVFTASFTLSAPALSQISIDYHTIDGTATSPDNYESSRGTLTIPAGQQSASFDIFIGELTEQQRADGHAEFKIHRQHQWGHAGHQSK